MAASMAPDAPSAWPYRPFVLLTGTEAAWSPRAACNARASAGSFSDVLDPCAFT
jgi:hypothetical protein